MVFPKFVNQGRLRFAHLVLLRDSPLSNSVESLLQLGEGLADTGEDYDIQNN